DNVDLAISAVKQRLAVAFDGVPAETRAATPDGQTVYLRPRPGASRMYPETDIPPIVITRESLQTLAGKVPQPWDQLVDSLSKKYALNHKLANQILDSDYLELFYEIIDKTGANPTFVSSKLTEDIVSLTRKGWDPSTLTGNMILEIFYKLQNTLIAKESVIEIFEVLMKKDAFTVDEAIKKIGATSITDDELSASLERIIDQNVEIVRLKGS